MKRNIYSENWEYINQKKNKMAVTDLLNFSIALLLYQSHSFVPKRGKKDVCLCKL